MIYTDYEFNKFIKTFENDYMSQNYKLLFCLLYYTGLRISELMALCFNDYKFDGKIHIYRQWQVIDCVGQFTSLKTENSNRIFALDDFTRNNLKIL